MRVRELCGVMFAVNVSRILYCMHCAVCISVSCQYVFAYVCQLTDTLYDRPLVYLSRPLYTKVLYDHSNTAHHLVTASIIHENSII